MTRSFELTGKKSAWRTFGCARGSAAVKRAGPCAKRWRGAGASKCPPPPRTWRDSRERKSSGPGTPSSSCRQRTRPSCETCRRRSSRSTIQTTRKAVCLPFFFTTVASSPRPRATGEPTSSTPTPSSSSHATLLPTKKTGLWLGPTSCSASPRRSPATPSCPLPPTTSPSSGPPSPNSASSSASSLLSPHDQASSATSSAASTSTPPTAASAAATPSSTRPSSTTTTTTTTNRARDYTLFVCCCCWGGGSSGRRRYYAVSIAHLLGHSTRGGLLVDVRVARGAPTPPPVSSRRMRRIGASLRALVYRLYRGERHENKVSHSALSSIVRVRIESLIVVIAERRFV
mmetsp:Transcript_1354/g.3942  ORF Transcript_1354/g.3942 Transcript_1354/m.3942 type:complete len:344 (-) Transcript_1354:8-1039(-)